MIMLVGIMIVPASVSEREGDLVDRIRIQCSCGQTLEFDCAY